MKVDEIASVVHHSVDPDANIIFGSTFDEKLTGKVRVSLIVTGMRPPVSVTSKPVSRG
jgi:cell division protein FtsZ